MKSLQQGEKETLTSCKDCVLAIYDNNTQTPCLANRIEKFEHIDAYDEEKEFFVIKRFCNYYRNNKEEYIKNEIVDFDRIKKESQITFDVVLLCNNIDYEYFKYLLDLYYNVVNNYGKEKVSFYILYTIATKEQSGLIKKLNSEIDNSSVTFYKDDIYLHNTISKTRNSYHVVIDKEKRPSSSFMSNLNDLVNNDIKKIITFVDNGVYCFSNLAYKIISYQKQSYVYNDIVENIINQSRQTDLYYE